MDLVIPGIALSMLYVATKQNQNKESFRSKLPNVDVPDKNYPEQYPVQSPELDLTSELSTNNKYDNAGGSYTDKYFNPNMNQSTFPSNTNVNRNAPMYYSLTGDKVDASYFQHNNMVPFFGSNTRTPIANKNNFESLLDSYTGSGSQSITKKEQSPLFAPNENLQWAHGMPNRTDFIQSRMNPSSRMANVKPFEEIHVGPGLGLGYTENGVAGYNSGMLARDQWMDKTADELRVANKPKATGLSLLGHEGPANSAIKKIATQEQMGIMEKNRPETSFAWDTRDMSQSWDSSSGPPRDIGRLNVTGGAEKGHMLRPVPIEPFVNRPETTTSYIGAAGSGTEASYIPGEYMPSHNQQLGELPFGVANANGRNYATDADYEIKAKQAYPNNRTVNRQDTYYGGLGTSVSAAIAPLLDILRPNRKSNVIGTLRPYQNPGTTVPNSYIFNPADRPATTIRETTEESKGHYNINAQQVGAYQVTEHQPTDTYRKDYGAFSYVGGSSAAAGTRQMTSYEANYNQRNNDLKSSTIQGYMVQGNMSLMNGNINMEQNNRDDMLKNNRALIGSMPNQVPHADLMGRPSGTSNQLYSNIQMDRNTPDITSALKSNPYVVDYRSML